MLLVSGECASDLHCKFSAFIAQVLKSNQNLALVLERQLSVKKTNPDISEFLVMDDMQLHVLREGKLHLLVIFHPVILSTFPKPHQ